MQVRHNRSPRDQQVQLKPLGPRSAARAWMSPYINSYQLKPNELFLVCENMERMFKAIDGKEFLHSLDRTLLFGEPVFKDGPASRKKNGYPLDVTITQPRGAESEWRYGALLKTLKRLDEADLRWLLIAKWLETEGICEAEAFLPREILERLLTRASKTRLQISPTDLQQARLIRIWLPYFKKLMSDAEKLGKIHRGPVSTLIKMGYIPTAIDSIFNRRSAVPATINWLVSREETASANKKPKNERTMEVAYSRVEASKQKFDMKVLKRIKPHQPDVDPRHHNFLYLIS